MLAATINSFHQVSPTAAYLLVPYFAWSVYATALTTYIYKNNPRVRTPPPASCALNLPSYAEGDSSAHAFVQELKELVLTRAVDVKGGSRF